MHRYRLETTTRYLYANGPTHKLPGSSSAECNQNSYATLHNSTYNLMGDASHQRTYMFEVAMSAARAPWYDFWLESPSALGAARLVAQYT